MPTISNVSFSVRFNLTGAPVLVLTDTTTGPPIGLVGIFTITQPDGYTRTGSIDSPDISSAGGNYSYTLSLDSSGGVQCGTYTIKYTAAAPGYLSTDFTRTFSFTYTPVSLSLTQEFDVFTPKLQYKDDTSYGVSGYSNGSITRAWTATSTPTGTLTGSTQTFDLAYGGNYYDAAYTITLSASLLYTHQTYSWLTVQETVGKTVTADACKPKTLHELVPLIESLRDSNCSGDIPEFEKAQTLLNHMVDMIEVQLSENEFQSDVYDVYNTLVAMFNVTCVHTNAIIPAYPISYLVGGKVPAGGTTGQVLTKYSNNDYAVEWSSSTKDVHSYANLAAFPATGAVDMIYIANDTNKVYRWTGSAYVEISAGGQWGSIAGTLSNQTDLQNALDAKVDENAAITGATKTKITYDSKGLVTGGADLSASDLPTGIDAAKIADGSISNTEFQYLNNVSSNIQTQLDGKVAGNTAITGATKTKITYDSKGLVTSGTDANLDDLGDVQITTPSAGQVVRYDGTKWVNGIGASALDDLTDVTITTPTSGQTLSYNGSQWVNAAPTGGITSLNSLTGATQTFATGTTGTDFGISSSGTTHTFNLPTASGTNTGKLSSADWTTFSAKQSAITLTTTGSSGASTFVSNTLNIPTYSLSGLGGTPTTRSLSINGTAYDLSADRSWSVGTVTSVSALTLGTTGTDVSSTVATGTTTPVITLNIPTASATNRGALSSTDWTAFNNKQNALTFGNLTEATSSVLTISNGTGSVIGTGTSIQVKQSSSTQSGFLSSTDWSTFNGKQSAITLTTTGSSGASTFVSNTLNIPTYSLSGLGGVPTTRSLTINGTALDLSSDRSWSVGTVTSVAAITLGTTGTDLSSTVATGTTTPVITLNVPDASATARGVITTGTQTIAGAKTFSTAPTFSSLTAGSVLFAGTSGVLSQDNSNFFWDNTNKRIGIGTSSPISDLDITKTVAGSSVYSRFVNNSSSGEAAISVRNDTSYGALEIFGSSWASTGLRNKVVFTSGTTAGFDILLYNDSATSNFSLKTTIAQTERLRVFGSTGNLVLQNGGTFTDAGYRLDVTGTTRLNGATEIPNTLSLSGSVTGTGNTSNYTVTASGGIARSKSITSTLTAAANNDTLVGIDINPTFTNGAFTGVTNWGLRVQKGGASVATTTAGATALSVSGTTGSLLTATDSSTGNRLQVNNSSGSTVFTVGNDGTYHPTSVSVSAFSTTPYNVISIDKTTGSSAFFDYYVKNTGTGGWRAGTVMAVWDGTNVNYTDTATTDLNAATSALTWSVAISGSNVQLRATLASGTWDTKVGARII